MPTGRQSQLRQHLYAKRTDLQSPSEYNYASLEKDLIALDREMKEIVSKNPSLPLIVSHPVYDSLARRYELNIKSVHWEPDAIPAIDQWENFQKIHKNHSAQWMIWEAEVLKKSLEILASIGVRSIVFDPCGNVPEKGDFLSVMRGNIENMKGVFR